MAVSVCLLESVLPPLRLDGPCQPELTDCNEPPDDAVAAISIGSFSAQMVPAAPA